jgi:hypothetical protein
VRERGATQIVYIVTGVLGRAVRLWLGLVEPRTDLPIMILDMVEPGAVGKVLTLRDQMPTIVVHAGPFDTPQAQALAAALPADLLVPLPPNTGERFGALTAPALLPAALQGLAWRDMLQQVRMGDATWRNVNEEDHPGFHLGAALGTSAQAGRDLLYLHVPSAQETMARWLEAFVSGALGKHRRGFVPFVNHAVISEQIRHSVVVQISDERSANDAAVYDHLHRSGVPVIRCAVNNPADVAVLVWTWQLAVAVSAMVIGLNPFDAPDADVINARIAQQVDHAPAALSGIPPDWRQSLQQARFLALAVYLPHENTLQLQQMCVSLAQSLRMPVTLLFPQRDWLWELQLLHAGRPHGAILALSSATPPSDPRLAPLHALQRAQLAVELDTWRRMSRPVAHLQMNKEKTTSVVDALSDLLTS